MDYYSFNRPRRDGWLSWPRWLTDSGRFTHNVATRPAISLAQDRESSPARTGGLTTMLRHQLRHKRVLEGQFLAALLGKAGDKRTTHIYKVSGVPRILEREGSRCRKRRGDVRGEGLVRGLCPFHRKLLVFFVENTIL